MKRTSTTQEDAVFGAFFLDGILDFVAENFQPEDIFPIDVLEDWAEDAGYVVDDNERDDR
jgi:hypothetical protein